MIDASRKILFAGFNATFWKDYEFEDILISAQETKRLVDELGVSINNTGTTNPSIMGYYTTIKYETDAMILTLQKPLDELCRFVTGENSDIDNYIRESLESIQNEIDRLINVVDEDILSTLTTSNGGKLIDTEIEELIHRYTNIGIIVTIVLLIIFGIVPLFFLIILATRRILCSSRDNHSEQTSKG